MLLSATLSSSPSMTSRWDEGKAGPVVRQHWRSYRASRPGNDGPGPHARRWTARGWNVARQTLEPLADLTNDGDEEGALFIDRLPLPDEAEPHSPLCRVVFGSSLYWPEFS